MIAQVVDLLREADNHLLITHEGMDGDAAGSTLALAHTLRAIGKTVTIVSVDPVPRPFQFLPGAEDFSVDCILGNYDLVTILDCGDLKRTGMAERIRDYARSRHPILNIDHHQRNDLHKLATLNYVDYQASSAAELVYPLVHALGVLMNKTIATCLLAGLYNDTGGFKHSNTSSKVLEQAAALLGAGARLKAISQYSANYRSVAALKLWGIALRRLRHHPVLGIVVSVITQEDFRSCNATPLDLAGCVNLLNSVPEAKAAILLFELEGDRVKASVRTEHDEIDVGALAALFGGGGIKKAAGFTFAGRIVLTSTGWNISVGSLVLALAPAMPTRLTLFAPSRS